MKRNFRKKNVNDTSGFVDTKISIYSSLTGYLVRLANDNYRIIGMEKLLELERRTLHGSTAEKNAARLQAEIEWKAI